MCVRKYFLRNGASMPATKRRFEESADSISEIELKKPKMFAVVMHNDDYTSMDFVVEVLEKVFNKNLSEATEIMFDIHNKGSRVVSVYTYDIAVSKSNMAMSLASDRGFPLMITVEEAME